VIDGLSISRRVIVKEEPLRSSMRLGFRLPADVSSHAPRSGKTIRGAVALQVSTGRRYHCSLTNLAVDGPRQSTSTPRLILGLRSPTATRRASLSFGQLGAVAGPPPWRCVRSTLPWTGGRRGKGKAGGGWWLVMLNPRRLNTDRRPAGVYPAISAAGAPDRA